jgi:hypothetical protein
MYTVLEEAGGLTTCLPVSTMPGDSRSQRLFSIGGSCCTLPEGSLVYHMSILLYSTGGGEGTCSALLCLQLQCLHGGGYSTGETCIPAGH